MKSVVRLARKLLGIQSDPIPEYRKAGARIGERVRIMDGVIMDYSHRWHISIGNDVIIAPRVHIVAHDASTKLFLGYTRLGKVTIGNRVFIGAGSILLPGVTIGDDVVIGAGSVVTRDIPSGSVAAGNPAAVLCPLEKFLDKRRKEMETCPSFGEEYTDDKGITDERKQQMNEAMTGGIGYVV